MTLFVQILADIIHFWKIIIFCDMFFGFRRRIDRHQWVLTVCAGSVISLISMYIYKQDNPVMVSIVYIISIIALLCVYFQERILQIVTTAIWIIFALSMLDTMNKVLFDISMDIVGLNGETISKLAFSIMSFILVYVLGKLYRKSFTIGMISLGVGNLICFSFLLIVDTLVITIIDFTNVEQYLGEYRLLYLIAVVFVILGIFVQLAAVIFLFMQRNVYKEKKQITEKYLEEQKNHYEYLENREKETKKFRHDMRSHMELISNFAKNHEYEQMDDYLEKIHIKIDELGNNVSVQNGIVDAIINQYYSKALEQGITMDVKGRLPEQYEVDAYDSCTIFSNVLSNALEAAAETEEKYVSVECRYNDKNIIIVVKNSFHNDYNLGNDLKTKKADEDYHGYGLENTKESIEKYHGLVDIAFEKNIFILTILFNNMGK